MRADVLFQPRDWRRDDVPAHAGNFGLADQVLAGLRAAGGAEHAGVAGSGSMRTRLASSWDRCHHRYFIAAVIRLIAPGR